MHLNVCTPFLRIAHIVLSHSHVTSDSIMKLNINKQSFDNNNARNQKLNGRFICKITHISWVHTVHNTDQEMVNPFFNIRAKIVNHPDEVQSGRSFRFCIVLGTNQEAFENKLVALLASLNLDLVEPTCEQIEEAVKKVMSTKLVDMQVMPPLKDGQLNDRGDFYLHNVIRMTHFGTLTQPVVENNEAQADDTPF